MELAYYFISNCEKSYDFEQSILFSHARKLSRHLKLGVPLRLTRLYLGSEFCERLFPSRTKLKSIIKKSSDSKLRTSFVTPVMTTESGIRKFKTLFRVLNDHGKFEVVVNSWGVLLLLQEYDNLEPVLGRNLVKMKKDPRIDFSLPPFDTSKALRQCSLTNPSFVTFLKKYGIKRVELDNVKQGLEINIKKTGLRAHLCFPKMPVTFSKHCYMGSANRKNNLFAPDGPCCKECQDYSIICEGNSNRSGEIPCVLGQFDVECIGRGVYMVNDSLEKVRIKDFNRIVFCI
jgi:collagenase-like PrtC family protease